jgi:sarcosine oxidase
MGSAACSFLARRGYRVLGLEQFDIPHELGSHLGQSRIIRKAYAEHSDYVPLLERAYHNWNALEHETDTQVYFKTGVVYFGNTTDETIRGVRESANKYHIAVRTVSGAEAARRYPHFALPLDYEGLEEPDAGFVTPERCILLYTEQAIRAGATIMTRTRVSEWTRDRNGITVKTTRGTFSSAKLVITAGPWAGFVIPPPISSRLRVTRQVMGWVIPRNWERFALGHFPCWFIDEYYGFPVLPVSRFGGPVGLKLARHREGDPADPDTINRMPTAADERDLVDALHRYIPDGYSETRAMKVCMYTNSPDGHFIVDYVPGFDRDVAVATGFSGHGFKFASVIGEILADLAMTGGTPWPIGFLNASRFS